MSTSLEPWQSNQEFSLLLKLTHPHSTPKEIMNDVVAEFRKPCFDLEKFLHMVRWHRVTPQVYQALLPIQDDLPVDFFKSLQHLNKLCRVESLKLSAWLAKITLLLRQKKIEFISLKGLGLSQLLYGQSSYRQCHDIDILIASENIDLVEMILKSVGFERTFPASDATPKQITFLNSHKKDRVYRNIKDGIIVEVHWRLTDVDHPFNPSLKNLLETGGSFSVHGEKITSVSGEHLWLYQSLHGSYSGWYRLRWVCDIALLLSHHQPDWIGLLDNAEKHHCKNSLLEAIGITCALYKLSVPEQIDPLLKNNKIVWSNINVCSNYLIHMKLMRGIPDIIRIIFWAPKMKFIKYLFTHGFISPADFSRFRLPDSLFYLYYCVRPFSFVYRHLKISKNESK